MSFLDDRDEDDIAYDVGTSAFANITGSIYDTHTAVVVLAIAGAAEIGGVVMLRMAKDQVAGALSDAEFATWIYAGIGVFVVGFLCAYGTHFLINKKWARPEARMMRWLISISAGLANILLFYYLAGGLDDLL
jgi:hypothetical protein